MPSFMGNIPTAKAEGIISTYTVTMLQERKCDKFTEYLAYNVGKMPIAKAEGIISTHTVALFKADTSISTVIYGAKLRMLLV